MSDSHLNNAINLCVTTGIPFVAYQLPQNNDIVFFANPSKLTNTEYTSNNSFHIGFFDNSVSPITIYNELNATSLLNSNNNAKSLPAISPHKISTTFETYMVQAKSIITQLKANSGKIVLSRVICGNHNITNWGELMRAYFTLLGNTFRYMYYTVETGCWIGASPEILLKKKSANQWETMSLAGTRLNTNGNVNWDDKNIDEHNYVTNYITDTIKSLGLTSTTYEAENLVFGEIEHLCNRIIIDSDSDIDISPNIIVNALSPTPALSGFPVDLAISHIKSIERHNRLCYGGYVTVESPDMFLSHVNLRCAHFDTECYCIYSGGGLTKHSIPEDEWNETENKVKLLKRLLS